MRPILAIERLADLLGVLVAEVLQVEDVTGALEEGRWSVLADEDVWEPE